MSAAVAPREAGWRAHLHLEFAHDGARTVLRDRAHQGPLYVQRPFYPEGDVCHVYILHPPAGMVGGDVLETRVRVAPGASALITTPASAKVYRSVGPAAEIAQYLTVGAGGTLEWLPQDTILFGGSSLAMQTRIEMESSARFQGWEMLSLGRPLSGDHYRTGDLRQRTVIHIDGSPRLIERQDWDAGDAILTEAWGLGGKSVLASFYIYPATPDLLDRARDALTEIGLEHVAATLLDNLLVVRALGEDATALREALATVWSQLRPMALDRPPCAPRIWAT